MRAALFLLLLVVIDGNPRIVCLDNDRRIYAKSGDTFPFEFRKLGGFSVSKTAYEEAISNKFGISQSCAVCYGNAYICGWDNCAVQCAFAGQMCSKCLDEAKCVQNCDICTGFK